MAWGSAERVGKEWRGFMQIGADFCTLSVPHKCGWANISGEYIHNRTCWTCLKCLKHVFNSIGDCHLWNYRHFAFIVIAAQKEKELIYGMVSYIVYMKIWNRFLCVNVQYGWIIRKAFAGFELLLWIIQFQEHFVFNFMAGFLNSHFYYYRSIWIWNGERCGMLQHQALIKIYGYKHAIQNGKEARAN